MLFREIGFLFFYYPNVSAASHNASQIYYVFCSTHIDPDLFIILLCLLALHFTLYNISVKDEYLLRAF